MVRTFFFAVFFDTPNGVVRSRGLTGLDFDHLKIEHVCFFVEPRTSAIYLEGSGHAQERSVLLCPCSRSAYSVISGIDPIGDLQRVGKVDFSW